MKKNKFKPGQVIKYFAMRRFTVSLYLNEYVSGYFGYYLKDDDGKCVIYLWDTLENAYVKPKIVDVIYVDHSDKEFLGRPDNI